MSAAKKVVLITGCSSGIGLALARLLASSGWAVVATVRDPAKAPAELKAAAAAVEKLDVADSAAVEKCVQAVSARHGRLDALVNNAGSGHVAPMETTSEEELRGVMAANFFGAWAAARAAVPIMREAGGGRIISVTSVGGLLGQPFNDAYCAAKFALEGAMESLHPIAAAFGVRVSVVEPGAVASSFVASAAGKEKLAALPPAYAPLIAAYMGRAEGAFKAAQKPEEVAEVIKGVLESDNPSFRNQTSDTSRFIASLTTADPTGNKVVGFTASWLVPPKA
ncbi:short-chain dehydrogenase/reductase [Hyaloraphidium curvatum]|nr:short-chain dehydrogenase/reductase [Hyaloraphidium curvatum]